MKTHTHTHTHTWGPSHTGEHTGERTAHLSLETADSSAVHVSEAPRVLHVVQCLELRLQAVSRCELELVQRWHLLRQGGVGSVCGVMEQGARGGA